jgi:hypothetical protein
MNCPVCGTTLQPGERFCGECGTNVVAWQQAHAGQPTQTLGPAPGPVAGPTNALPPIPPVAVPPPVVPPPYQAPVASPYTPYPVQATPYAPPVAPATNQGPARAIGWGLIIAGVVLCVLLSLLTMVGSEPPDPTETASYQMGYRLGQMACGIVPLILFAGAGAVVLLLNRGK